MCLKSGTKWRWQDVPEHPKAVFEGLRVNLNDFLIYDENLDRRSSFFLKEITFCVTIYFIGIFACFVYENGFVLYYTAQRSKNFNQSFCHLIAKTV